MNRFYNTGFIDSRDTEHRLKQGFLPHDVINVCTQLGTSCNQNSLYPEQQVQMDFHVNIPITCDCSFYMTQP